MERCQRIYEHPLYQHCMENIERAEVGRIFCLHGIEHSMDTARIGYIMLLEQGINIDKELFYAAALLHDSGRYNPIIEDHAEASAVNAELIMPDCGFDEDEVSAVAAAIRSHRANDNADILGRILYEADKKSRLCYNCDACGECYWEEDKRNCKIEI